MAGASVTKTAPPVMRLSLSQAAKRLALSKKDVLDLVADGRLSCVWDGRRFLFLPDVLDAFQKSGGARA